MELTEHKKLKQICDKIGYNTFNNYWDWIEFHEWWPYWYISVKEIIFTQEFVYKFEKYYLDNLQIKLSNWWSKLWYNLDNPVDYLHTLLFTECK
jgi:hypothetical protein